MRSDLDTISPDDLLAVGREMKETAEAYRQQAIMNLVNMIKETERTIKHLEQGINSVGTSLGIWLKQATDLVGSADGVDRFAKWLEPREEVAS